MGYALFANRKLYYTNLIFTLQSRLDNIMQEKNRVLTFSANISDGIVSVEELAQDPANFANYVEFLNGAAAYKDADEADGGMGTRVSEIGSVAYNQNPSEENLAAIAELLDTAVNELYVKQTNKQLEVYENQLDMEQKKIETKLTAAQNELKAIEQAEGQAIENATPKYTGVGNS